jgi:hypothetical protein
MNTESNFSTQNSVSSLLKHCGYVLLSRIPAAEQGRTEPPGIPARRTLRRMLLGTAAVVFVEASSACL